MKKPACKRPVFSMGLGRFELPTSPLSGVRSSQLSYKPEMTSGKRWADIVAVNSPPSSAGKSPVPEPRLRNQLPPSSTRRLPLVLGESRPREGEKNAR
jgi:hypothetical protein